MVTNLIFILKTAIKFLARSWRATFVLAFMIFISVATLIFLSALATGTNDAMIRNSVGLYSGNIQRMNLPDSLRPEALEIKGVKHVLVRKACPGILKKDDHIETILLTGIDSEKEKKATGLYKKTIKGKYLSGKEKEIYIGQILAKKLDLDIDSRLYFQKGLESVPVEFTVSGIFKTGIGGFDDEIAFCNLKDLPEEVLVWNAAIFLEEGKKPQAIIAEYEKITNSRGEFLAWYDLMPDLKQLTDLNQVCMDILTVIVFAIVAVGVACAFVIFILKNLREYGILKTMGLSPGLMAFFIMAKVTILNLFAALSGVVAGALLCWWLSGSGIDISQMTSHNKYFVISGIIYPRLTAGSLLAPPILAFVLSSAAALWPMMIVLRSNVAKILRNR
ncbi:MAG: ABC transporter permease [Desulfobacterium sp.]|nr:ABC transporter permease [Desulfobacterium sp.]MBU3948791.1 ABC transporter permease [Pseudomonadota bacterium]MBU4011438.1 ABC transporter permease [Pseudomonadota bacterium]MBU4035151.1 ABC transporter permease [Pseudomonadota bacterium]